MATVGTVAGCTHYTHHKSLSCSMPLKVDSAGAFLVACQVALAVCAVIANIACGGIYGIIPVKNPVIPVPQTGNFRFWGWAFYLLVCPIIDNLSNIYLDIFKSFYYEFSLLNCHLFSPMTPGGFLVPNTFLDIIICQSISKSDLNSYPFLNLLVSVNISSPLRENKILKHSAFLIIIHDVFSPANI